MIERIIWRQNLIPRELESPFQRGEHERPLRLTLHLAGMQALTVDEQLVIDTIRNLGSLSQVDVMEIEVGSYYYPTFDDEEQAFKNHSGDIGQIRIGPYKPEDENIPIYYSDASGYGRSGIHTDYLYECMTYFAQYYSPESPEYQSLLIDLIPARAHHELYRDIFVTKSHNLLGNWSFFFIKESNPRTPLEAAKLVGLYLRSRNLFVHETKGSGYAGVTRDTFYWASVDLKMPHIWYCQNVCKAAGIFRAKETLFDDTGLLMISALSRCSRVLKALDSIAFNFYVPQDNDVHDDTLYHFYYLALLLSGVLDVQAIIAHRAYKVSKAKEKHASFINDEFITKLNNHGAIELSRLFTKGSDGYYIIRLLHEIRNTIHRVEFPVFTLSKIKVREVHSWGTLVEVVLPHDNMEILLESINNLGGMERWGFQKKANSLLLEPYTFSITLIEECFELIDKIAENTNLNNLFPNSISIPSFPPAPPRNTQWSRARKIIAILG